MAFKIKDGVRVGTTDVFNNSGTLLVTAPKAANLTGGNSTTLLGSLPYQSDVDTTSLLSPNTSSTIKVLTQTGNGTNGAAPVWTSSTGTGNVVFATSPSLTTPTLGVASATSINKVAFTAPATGSTLTIADGKTLTASNTLTFTGTDSSSVAFSSGGTVAYTANKLSVFASTSSSELLGVISDETGSGSLVFATAPTFTTSIDGGTTFAAFGSSSSLTLGYSGALNNTTNITNGSTASGNTATVNIGVNGLTGSTTNINLGSSAGGTVTVNKDLTVMGNLDVKGTTTFIESTTVQVTDKNLEIGKVGTPTDTTADGGGITLLGATNKTIIWDNANSNWTSSENWNLASGKVFKINNTSVLSSSTLGSGVTGSSLTSVGTIGTGVWQGTVVGATYGGTGVNNGSNTITLGGNISTAGAFTTSGAYGVTLTATGTTSVTLPTSGTLATTTNATFGSGSTWNGNVIGAAYGGTGVANNAASTITISGAYATTLTVSNTTSVTLPTTGTLATLAGTETLTNKSFNSSVNYQTGAVTIANENVVQVTGIVTTSPTTVDTWAKATYRSAKYLVQVTQGSNYQVSEIMVIQDGTNTYMTEFAVIETNGVLATFTSSISGANAQLIVTMGSVTSATINIQRTLLVV